MTTLTQNALIEVPLMELPDATVNSELRGARFIFAFYTLELGGAERQAIHLAAHLKRVYAADVQVWAFAPPGPVASLCQQHGIPHRSFEPPLQGGALSKLLGMASFTRELRRARPDVLMPYTMGLNVLCGLTWRLGGVRLCIWNQRDEGRGRIGGRAEAWAVRRTPLFISNSAHARDFLTGTLGADPGRVFVVRNGIELPSPPVARRQWRTQHNLPQDQLLACMVANLHSYKDHTTLLKAWRQAVDTLASHQRQATLLLAGRFDDMAAPLQNLAMKLRLGQSVQFLGPVSDVASLLGAVDLCTFSSRCEGCPNGVLESMAAGLPVIATDIPGVREALGGQSDEYLSPPGDAAAMAGNIAFFLLDESLRHDCGSANRQRVQRCFGVDRMCGETASIIAQALRHH